MSIVAILAIVAIAYLHAMVLAIKTTRMQFTATPNMLTMLKSGKVTIIICKS